VLRRVNPRPHHVLGRWCPVRRPHPAATPSAAPPSPGQRRHNPVLASPPRNEDGPTRAAPIDHRSTRSRRARGADGAREQAVGVSEDPGRTAQTRPLGMRLDDPQGPPDSSGTHHTAMVIRDIGAQVLVSWRPSLGSCCPWQRIGSSTSPADSALAPTAQPRWVTAAMGDQQPCLRYRAGRELRRATGPAEQDQRTAAVRMRQCSRARWAIDEPDPCSRAVPAPRRPARAVPRVGA
jgi:hypothetical protein